MDKSVDNLWISLWITQNLKKVIRKKRTKRKNYKKNKNLVLYTQNAHACVYA